MIDYIFKKSFRVFRFKITIEMRSKNKFWGRFGGGWNWELGFQASKHSIIFNLLVMSIRIDKC